jgi:hypothetical protein
MRILSVMVTSYCCEQFDTKPQFHTDANVVANDCIQLIYSRQTDSSSPRKQFPHTSPNSNSWPYSQQPAPCPSSEPHRSTLYATSSVYWTFLLSVSGFVFRKPVQYFVIIAGRFEQLLKLQPRGPPVVCPFMAAFQIWTACCYQKHSLKQTCGTDICTHMYTETSAVHCSKLPYMQTHMYKPMPSLQPFVPSFLLAVWCWRAKGAWILTEIIWLFVVYC